MSDVKVTYDQAADVLYVTYKDVPATRGVEMGGVVRRYALNDELAGVTIIDFASLLRTGALSANITTQGAEK